MIARSSPRRNAAVRIALLALSLAVPPSSAVATGSDDPDGADPHEPVYRESVVVSATGVPVERAAVGSSVTVLDRTAIERRNETTVAELLRAVPGTAVARTGGPGGSTSVFLRGGNSSHTLVLVDGVRVNAATGAFDWADMTTDGIERIEILRGPQSALYGSEALGGVVSIYTRRGDADDGFRASAEVGNLSTSRLAVDGAGAAGPWDWSVAASRNETDGVSRADEDAGNVEDDPWEASTVAGSLGRRVGRAGDLRWTVRHADATTGLDAFDFALGPVDDPNYEQDHVTTSTALRLRLPVTERYTQTLRVGYAEDDLRTRDPDPTPTFHDSRIESATSDVDLQADVDVHGTFDLSLGAEHERRSARSRGNFDEDVDLSSVWTEARLRPAERLWLTAGVRHDDHSAFGAETTWRAVASWRPALRGPRLHATAGTGFKAPSFIDLYFPFYGNPDLRPETSESVDVGVEHTWGGGAWTADVTAFASDVRDLIVFDTTTFLAGNVAAADIEGVEATLGYRPHDRAEVRVAYTRTDAVDEATGAPLPRRPEHHASASLFLAPTGRLRGTLTVVAVRDRFDAGGVRLDDYETADVSLEADLRGPWSAFARVRNLLDEDVQELAGFTSPGRSGVVGVRFRP